MSDATDPPEPPSETERIIHGIGNHITLCETHLAQVRVQLALLAHRIEGN
jgi:hypothetical protein